MNIRKDIENILCECDPDRLIPDENLDKMVEELMKYIVKRDKESNINLMIAFRREAAIANNQLEEITNQLYNIGQYIISLEG